MCQPVETTKLRVVYDASARANSGALSLNECLNPAPAFRIGSVMFCPFYFPLCCKLRVVIAFITGRDGVVRGAKPRTPKLVIERPVQHLYPLELTCDMTAAPVALKPTVPAFGPRRNAAGTAKARIQELVQMDDEN